MAAKQKQMHYVSEIDQFMQEFDKKHPEPSKSQQREIEKHQRIFRLRDDPNYTESDDHEIHF